MRVAGVSRGRVQRARSHLTGLLRPQRHGRAAPIRANETPRCDAVAHIERKTQGSVVPQRRHWRSALRRVGGGATAADQLMRL